MREVFSNFFIGNELDYETTVRGSDSWAVVHACKEPYHRQALGYSGRGAPKGHPEYLIARQGYNPQKRLTVLTDLPIIRIKDIYFPFLHHTYSQTKESRK